MVRVTLREREDWRAAVLGAQVSPLSLLGDTGHSKATPHSPDFVCFLEPPICSPLRDK